MQDRPRCGRNHLEGAESDVGQIAFHIMLAAGFAVAVVSASPAAAGGKGKRGSACIPVVQCWLQQGGVDMTRVDSIKIDKRSRTNGQGDRVFKGYQGWVRFKDEDGAIVFSMHPDCQLQRSWTKGDIEWSQPGGTC